MNKLFARFSYFQEVAEELKKVSWPSRQQTLQLTTLVIGVTVLVGVYISILDFGFTKLIQLFLQ